MTFWPRDTFADRLIIPDSIEFDYPIGYPWSHGEPRTDSMQALPLSDLDFQLYCSMQPGLFLYDFTFFPKTSGVLYLKAYETTTKVALSEESLRSRSELAVESSGKLERFQYNGHFTIYEGVWDKPYGARFEVWFRSDEGPEFKLTEKHYIIEGWMH